MDAGAHTLYLAQCLRKSKCYEVHREEMLQVWKSTHFQAAKGEVTNLALKITPFS